jgi:hypothetical protein
MSFLKNLSFATAALCGLSLAASANGGIPEAGSLLIFPTFENGRGEDTLITITNTNSDHTPTVGTLEAGTVDVEYIYIDGYDCFEFNRTRRFTPNDTITVSARADNPNDREGYVYAFAKSPTTGQAISWNWLIGIERTVEGGGDDEDFDVNPYVFKAIGAQGSATDLNSDGNRNLNGLEYEAGPDQLLVPRFVGQGGGNESELTLINLTGGGRFNAIVNFLIYNDNEEVFSAQYEFFCWEEVDLDDISGLFDEDFLETTNHAVNEHANGNEYGWFRMDGAIAYSTADTELDPMILALLAENIGPGDGGELPWGEGTQTNGEVLSFNVFYP